MPSSKAAKLLEETIIRVSYNQIVCRALSSSGTVENSLGVQHLLQ